MRNIQKKFAENKENTHFIFNNFFPRKSCALRDNVEKYGRARQATDDSKITAHKRRNLDE